MAETRGAPWWRQAAARSVDFYSGPTDPIRLRVFRTLLVFSLLLYVADRSLTPLEWLTDRGFHFSAAAQPYGELPPAPLLRPWLVPPFLTVYFASMVLLLLGWKSRAMIVVVLACTTYVTVADALTAYTLNRVFIIALAALACAPPSVPVEGAGKQQSVWPIRALQAMLLAQYFTAGTCKVFHGDWLHLGFYHGDWQTNPIILWTQAQGVYTTVPAAWMLRHLPMWTWTVQQYLALMFELFAPLLFMFRRTRLLAILWGIGFHSVVALTMYKLFYFSFQMMIFYVLWLEPEWLHRANRWTRGLLAGDGGELLRRWLPARPGQAPT